MSELLSIVHKWSDAKVPWWQLRDSKLPDRVATPLTTSRDEWAEAFLGVSKLVVEGFEVSAIRARLKELGIPYEKKEQSIALLERLVHRSAEGERPTLSGLRAIQVIRTKAKGHASGRELEALVHDILTQHESFSSHFKEVCRTVCLELQEIAGSFAHSK